MATALMAQPPGGGFRRHAVDPNSTQVTPAARPVRMLTRFLDLTSAQQTQITNILAADSTNLDSLQATLKTERANLITAIKGNSGVSSASAALSSTQGQIEAIRAAEAAAIYQTLTADQKTKLGDGLGALMGGGGFGPGRRGGPQRKQ
jgi:Spy/CpxP family protein refolding chaperone